MIAYPALAQESFLPMQEERPSPRSSNCRDCWIQQKGNGRNKQFSAEGARARRDPQTQRRHGQRPGTHQNRGQVVRQRDRGRVRRERLLGIDAIDTESCAGWLALPRSLHDHGGALRVTSNAHERPGHAETPQPRSTRAAAACAWRSPSPTARAPHARRREAQVRGQPGVRVEEAPGCVAARRVVMSTRACKLLSQSNLASMAFFVFQAASARARLISANFSIDFNVVINKSLCML